MRAPWTAVTVATALLGTPALARAGNDDSLLHGSDAAMTGGAVTATTEDGAAAYYNPAGLANITRGQVNVSANAIVLQRLRVSDFLQSSAGDATDQDVVVIPFIPAAVTFSGKLSDDVSFGGGIFVSQQFAYTLRASLDTETAFAGRPVPFDFTLAVEQREINTVPGFGLGFDVSPDLRLGVSIFGRYREQYGALVFGAGTTSVRPDDPAVAISTNSSAGGAGAGLEARVGVQWDPHPGITVGASIWTPTFNVLTTTQQTETFSEADTLDGASVVYVPGEVNETRWGFDQVSSWRFRLGAAFHAHWGWVAIDGDFQPAYENVALGVERQHNWALRAGAKIRISDGVALGIGAFTDRSAQPRGRVTTFAPNIDLYGGTLGIAYEEAHVLGRDERARDIRFMTGFTLRVAYGQGDFGGIFFAPENLFPEAGEEPDTFLRLAESPASLLELALYISSGLYF